jgi:hypothetical protein
MEFFVKAISDRCPVPQAGRVAATMLTTAALQ